MKRYRPYCSGFIVMYVLVAIGLADAGYTLFCQITGRLNQFTQSFSFFSYLIAVMAVAYIYIFVRAQVCIDDKNIRAAFPAYIKPPAGGGRAMILYRQGPLDLKLVDKTFPLSSIERYGYVSDFGLSRVDSSSATEKSPLLPVKEVCFLTHEGKRYHLNAAIYNKKQLKEMFTQIRDATGIEPEGSLAEVLK